MEERNISGVWAKLDISSIQLTTATPLNVVELVLSDLLPTDQGYYYYKDP